jgi:hypothetical protein
VEAQVDSDALAVVERLSAIVRRPASPGEGDAAEIVRDELAARGARAWIEPERVHGTYWVPIGIPLAAAAWAGVRGKAAGALVGAGAAASIADDLLIGRRPLRRVLRQRNARNVVAELGPRNAERTLVIHAHHDAAPSGLIFHPAIAKTGARLAGGLIERVGGTPAPMWGAVGGPVAIAIAAASRFAGIAGLQWLRWLGLALSTGYAAAMADIGHREAVPGANDNLSGVYVLLALAAQLAAQPPERLRVLVLSTGSEESFLEAMQRFLQRHGSELPIATTTFLCLESVGSPELMLLSGEGLLRAYRYPRGLIDVLTRLAAESGVSLRSPFRYRLATDGQVPLQRGYPVAVISSMDWYKAPSNYHWPSDRVENLAPASLAGAARLARRFVDWLDGRD